MNVAWLEEWEKTFKEVREYLEKEGKPLSRFIIPEPIQVRVKALYMY